MNWILNITSSTPVDRDPIKSPALQLRCEVIQKNRRFEPTHSKRRFYDFIQLLLITNTNLLVPQRPTYPLAHWTLQ